MMINALKRFLKKHFWQDAWIETRWIKANPYHGFKKEWSYQKFTDSPTVGIIYDIAQEHQNYITACLDLKINYRVFDIRADNWKTLIKDSGCDMFLIWPTIYKPIQKTFWDERIWSLTQLLGKKVFPSEDLLWVYESKRRTKEWLEANGYDHPSTRVFFSKKAALSFIEMASFPLVLKTDQGAGSSGVYIIRTKKQAKKWISRAFGSGIKLKNRGMHDVHSGYILFQEYLPNCKEWRIIRVGDSYFCRFKLKKGDFHSGSGDIVWARPPEKLLKLTQEISSHFELPNLNVDFFETEDGRFLVNELHALWGGKVLKDEDLEGRYIHNQSTNKWEFEKGDFFGHRCAELRIKWLLENQWL